MTPWAAGERLLRDTLRDVAHLYDAAGAPNFDLHALDAHWPALEAAFLSGDGERLILALARYRDAARAAFAIPITGELTMSASLNEVILIGRLAFDPDTRSSNAGKSYCRLPLAVNRWARGSNGEPGSEQTDFIDGVAFGALAERLPNFTSKGSLVLVRGRLATSQRDDRRELVLLVNQVDALARP